MLIELEPSHPPSVYSIYQETTPSADRSIPPSPMEAQRSKQGGAKS